MKSHVGMGYEVCPICLTKHDETVLLDKRLRNTLERDNFTGFSLCPPCKELSEEYVAIVIITDDENSKVTLQTANRTGEIIHIKRVACRKIFNMEPRDMMWGTEELATKLKGIIHESNA